jgi:hypothetical protein
MKRKAKLLPVIGRSFVLILSPKDEYDYIGWTNEKKICIHSSDTKLILYTRLEEISFNVCKKIKRATEKIDFLLKEGIRVSINFNLNFNPIITISTIIRLLYFSKKTYGLRMNFCLMKKSYKNRVSKKRKSLQSLMAGGVSWRRGWDSNPRGIAPKLISSQPRYDHFDTSPDNGGDEGI